MKPTALWMPSYLKHEQTITNMPTSDCSAIANGNAVNATAASYGSNGTDSAINMTDIMHQSACEPSEGPV